MTAVVRSLGGNGPEKKKFRGKGDGEKGRAIASVGSGVIAQKNAKKKAGTEKNRKGALRQPLKKIFYPFYERTIVPIGREQKNLPTIRKKGGMWGVRRAKSCG